MTLLPLLAMLAACDDPKPPAPEDTADLDTAAGWVDADGDRYGAEDDCDDGDASIFPGAEEPCDGVDNNCNGLADEGYEDADADAVPDCLDAEECDGLDNDGDALVDEDFADGDGDALADCLDSEDCDGADNDGDGDIDEGYDGDGDGSLPCGAEDADAPLDCDDGDPAVSPDQPEVAGNLLDDDCDGLVDEGAWAAGDLLITELMVNPEVVTDPYGEWIELQNTSDRTLYLDGLSLVTGSGQHAVARGSLLAVEPGALVVLGLAGPEDNGGVEVAYVYEGVSMSNEVDSLSIYAGDVLLDEVAWDDGATFPDLSGASMSLDPEFMNTTDNDQGGLWCVGEQVWSEDGDRGSPGAPNPYCTSLDRDSDGYSPEEGDCQDDNDAVGPHASETPYDGVDNDCDPSTPDDDLDGDGFPLTLDCDDADATVNPGEAEVCDGADKDEDCSGQSDDDDPSVTGTTTWYYDGDGDTYGDDEVTGDSCNAPPDYVAASGDCDDTDPAYNPGASEADCDDPDYNCDGALAKLDADSDGFGDCDDDCDPTDPSVHPYAFEVNDGVDNDCDGDADFDDEQVPTAISLSDDDYEQIVFTDFSFSYCGTSYDRVYISSNGRLTFGFGDTGLSESSSEFDVDRSFAGLWDDLNPSSGGSVQWIEFDDAVGVYFRAVYEYGTSSPNTFGMLLREDGRLQLLYEDINVSDAGAGWSCGSGGAGTTSSDLSADAADIPTGSAGIGQGTETGYYEIFAGGFDLANTALTFCVNSGTDADGDDWTDECGDLNDADPSVYP